MSNEKSDLELLNRIAQGGNLTSADTGADLSNSSNSIRTLQEGTTTLHYGLKSIDKKDSK